MLRRVLQVVVVGCVTSLASGQNTAPSPRPEALLPEGTLFYVGTDDLDALIARSKGSPLGQILAEQEMKDFLAKPLAEVRKLVDQGVATAKQLPTLAQVELDPDKILAGSYGRAFIAFTHLNLPANPVGDRNAIDVGVVLGFEPRAGAVDVIGTLKQVVSGFAEAGAAGAAKLESVAADGFTYERIRPPNSGVALCFANLGGLSVMSLSEQALTAMFKRASGGGSSLASDANFARCVAAVGKPATGDLVIYMHMGQLMEMTHRAMAMAMQMSGEKEAPAIVDKVFEVSKLTSFGPIYTTSTWRDGASINLSYHEVDPAVGGLAAFQCTRPIDRDLVKFVPKDALGFSISSFEIAPLYDMVIDGLKQVQPSIHEMAMQKIHEFETLVAGADAQGNPNWDIRRDLIGAIGGRMMSMTTRKAANSMMGAGADWSMWIETPNGAGLDKSLAYLCALPGQLAGYPLKFKEEAYGDAKLHVLDMASLGMVGAFSGSLQPTYAIQGGRLWFATSAKALKKALDAEQNPPAENVTAKSDFLKHFVEPPKGAVITSLSYSDTATNFENGYSMILGTLQNFLPMMGKDLPIDTSLLPLGETISKHLFGTVSVSYRVGQNGFVEESRGPFGPETVLAGVVAGAGIASLFAVRTQSARPHNVHPVAKETAAHGPDDTAAQVKHDLANICDKIKMYVILNDKAPATLDELTKATPDFPKGMLEGSVPLDPWKHAYSYRIDTADSVTVWSFGPNGVDDKGEGDDIAQTLAVH